MEYLLIPILLSVITGSVICYNRLGEVCSLLRKHLAQARCIADEEKERVVPPPPVSLGDTELHTQTEIRDELLRTGKSSFFD